MREEFHKLVLKSTWSYRETGIYQWSWKSRAKRWINTSQFPCLTEQQTSRQHFAGPRADTNRSAEQNYGSSDKIICFFVNLSSKVRSFNNQRAIFSMTDSWIGRHPVRKNEVGCLSYIAHIQKNLIQSLSDTKT